MWPDRHGDVDEEEPEGHEWNEVVEVVRPIHDKTQHDDEKVHSEHHLEQQTSSVVMATGGTSRLSLS